MCLGVVCSMLGINYVAKSLWQVITLFQIFCNVGISFSRLGCCFLRGYMECEEYGDCWNNTTWDILMSVVGKSRHQQLVVVIWGMDLGDFHCSNPRSGLVHTTYPGSGSTAVVEPNPPINHYKIIDICLQGCLWRFCKSRHVHLDLLDLIYVVLKVPPRWPYIHDHLGSYLTGVLLWVSFGVSTLHDKIPVS
jgi:hypothetical protein